MSFDNQSYKDDVCLSLNSSFEEHNTQREDSNTPNFNLIKIDSSVSFIQFRIYIVNVNSIQILCCKFRS